ncbi:neuroparsin-A-like [Cimex lectularius]|uniref:Neuropeptide precursor n=1 Tax=Cimex lectularius TaxID=79782 RepID=A0A8I6SAG5_CIMLE|nr:neuroparsin-A-like [Cimex lectularius]
MLFRFLIIFSVLLMAWEASGLFSLCIPCNGEECDVEPTDCLDGVVKDACGRYVCGAGPGERCGGRANHLGKCGIGMTCKCGKCIGCSTARIMRGEIVCEDSHPMCE